MCLLSAFSINELNCHEIFEVVLRRDGDDDSESCHSSRNESKRERKARRRKQKRSNANLGTKDSPPRKKNEWNFEEPDDDFDSAFDSAEESEPMRIFEKTNQSGFNKSFLEVSSGEDWLLDLHDCSPLSYMSFIIQRILLAVESNYMPAYLPVWIRGGIETFDTGKKGRGVRTIIKINAGHAVIIEPPIASADTSEGDDKIFVMDKMERRHASDDYLTRDIIVRVQREAVLSKIVNCLHDGVNQQPVTSLKDLRSNFESCPVLLPSHYEYISIGKRVNLSANRIASM
eukprot:scaffold1211_cov227-Chaetoceros_neogracile.AAC.6